MEQETQLLRAKAKELQKYFIVNNPLLVKLEEFMKHHIAFTLHAESCDHCGKFNKPSPVNCLPGYTLASAIGETIFQLEEEYKKKGATENGALDNKTD